MIVGGKNWLGSGTQMKTTYLVGKKKERQAKYNS